MAKFKKNISEDEWIEKVYEVAKELMGSFAIGRHYEDFKHPSRKERASFVAVGIAESLLKEIGFKRVVGEDRCSDETREFTNPSSNDKNDSKSDLVDRPANTAPKIIRGFEDHELTENTVVRQIDSSVIEKLKKSSGK